MKTNFKRITSLLMSVLMILSTMVCLSGVSFAADAVTETEPNDGSNTATEIPTNTTCSGALNHSKDVDWYKFTADKDYFIFDFDFSLDETNYANLNKGWDVYLLDADGKEIFVNRGTQSKFSTAIYPLTGDFFIKVDDTALSSFTDEKPINCVYNIKVNTFEAADWEDENNDVISKAFSINTDSTYHGTLHHKKDVDWYKFTNEKDYFIFDFAINEEANVDLINYGWKITIYAEDGATIIKEYKDVKSNFKSVVLPFTGDGYIKVEPDGSASFTSDCPIDCYYDIRVNTYSDTSWEEEFNDTTKTCNTLKADELYRGSLYKSKDVDYYSFESNSDCFNFEFAIDENSPVDTVYDGWKVSLYTYGSTEPIVSYNNVVKPITSFDIPYKGKLVIKVEADDTWYSPVDCIYNIKVTQHEDSEKWETEVDDEFKTATELITGILFNANLDRNRDVDYFKYKALENGVIDFKFTRDAGENLGYGWNVSVLNANGKVVYTTTVLNDLEISEKNIDVSKDETIYIKVEAKDTWDVPKYINYTVSVDFKPAPAKVEKVKASNPTTSSFKVTWAKVENADEYEVAFSTDGKTWKKIKTDKTSVTLKKLKSGKTYKVKVRAIADSVKGKYSSVATSATKVSKVTLSSVKSTKKAMANVAWKTVTGASGYVVEYSTSKKFSKSTTKTVKVKKGASKKTTLKKLKSGKKYYVRVKAYKTVNGKAVYGAYSSVKSVKVK